MNKSLLLSLGLLLSLSACNALNRPIKPSPYPTTSPTANPSGNPSGNPSPSPTAPLSPLSLADIANQNLLNNSDAEAPPTASADAAPGWTGKVTAETYGHTAGEFSEGWGASHDYGLRYFRVAATAPSAGAINAVISQTVDLSRISQDIDNNFVGFKLRGDLTAQANTQAVLEISFMDAAKKVLQTYTTENLSEDEKGSKTQTLESLFVKNVGNQVPDGTRSAEIRLRTSCNACTNVLAAGDNLSFTVQPIR